MYVTIELTQDELDELVCRLASSVVDKLRPIAGLILNKENTIMATIQDVQDDVTAETTLIGGISTMVAGLKQQVADALSGVTLPTSVQAQVDAVFASAEANKVALTAALAANTTIPPQDTSGGGAGTVGGATNTTGGGAATVAGA